MKTIGEKKWKSSAETDKQFQIAKHIVDNAPNEAMVLLRFKGNALVDAHPIKSVDASPFFPGALQYLS